MHNYDYAEKKIDLMVSIITNNSLEKQFFYYFRNENDFECKYLTMICS